jgi:hypothetical protein
MTATSPFLERLEHDLRKSYTRHSARRRRRRTILLIAAVGLVFAASASAASGILGWFTIDQNGHVSITGTPPAQISCIPSGCVLPTAETTGAGDRLLYEFSHQLGDDLPNTGNISESLPGQGVFDHNGNELAPPTGAELAYVCTTIDGNQLGCSPLSTAGATLPRGAAIYILSPSEYGPAR